MGDKDGGEVLSTQQLRSHLYTFMFAGFDTSASVIHWILYYVGQFPEMVKQIGKVQNDIHIQNLILKFPGHKLDRFMENSSNQN